MKLRAVSRQFYNFYKGSFEGLSRPVWLLSVVLLINRSGAMVVPFLTLYLTTQLGFSKTDAGWIMSAYGAGSVCGAYLGGILTDRLGYYTVQVWSLLLTGIMFFLLLTAGTFTGFAALVFLTSFMADIFRPANMVAVGAYSSEENRTRSFALMRLAVNLGYAIGPAIGGFIIMNANYSWLFMIDGGTCIVAAFFFYFFLPKRKVEAPTDKNQAAADISSVSKPIWKDYNYLYYLLFTMLLSLVFLQLLSVWPVYWEEVIGLSESQIGLLFTLNCLLITAFEMPTVFLLEKRKRILPIMAVGAALIGLSYGVNIMGASMLWVLFSVVYITIGEVLNMPFSTSYAMQISPVDKLGKYMSYHTIAWSSSFMVAPVAAFYVIENYGYNTIWMIDAVLAAVAALGFWNLKEVEQ